MAIRRVISNLAVLVVAVVVMMMMMMMMMIHAMVLVPCCFALVAAAEQEHESLPTLTCSASHIMDDELDPALQEMEYDLGDGGPRTAWVYVEPNVTTFYQLEPPPASTKVVPKFTGFHGKFINLSPHPVSLYWQNKDQQQQHLIGQCKAFDATSTAVFPGHHFYFTQPNRPNDVLQFFLVGDYPQNFYIYNPLLGDDTILTVPERQQYDRWIKTLQFHDFYRNVTGRSYLANYLRPRPIHHMWRADYFGQEHWATTRETHFVQLPPSSELKPIQQRGSTRRLTDDKPRALSKYRDPSLNIMNLTLKVLSVAPRVFEIRNFLSPVEVDHILDIAGAVTLKPSITGDGESNKDQTSRGTRTSFNSWIKREMSPVVDAIYRRAADLLLVDEALMRQRSPGERPDVPTLKPLSEHLQLVHYGVDQEYTSHHDFGYHRMEQGHTGIQAARFSTLLLYLNNVEKGGETSFPRFVNAKTFDKLKVQPEAGKAVLFYSQLPDGNLDDFSHHAAEPVRVGEKWLINLWLWDPIWQR